MCQLLIVDDETSVVDSLALTINWEDYGIQQVHRAYSAQDALDIAAKQTINIMITDIQMPEMNGFDLIDKIKAFSPKIRNIILSGHDDFHYAQKAIRQQTIEYLLKPVDIKMLIKTVENAFQSINVEKKETDSYQRMKHTLDANMPMLKSQLLNDLLSSQRMDPNFKKNLAIYDVPFKPGDLFTMMVIRLDEGFSGDNLQSMSLYEYAVNNIAEEVIKELFDVWNCITEEGYLVFLIKINNRDALKLVESNVVKLQNYVQFFLKGSLTISLSNNSIFPDDLRSLYLTAIEKIKQNEGKGKSSSFTTVKDIPKQSMSVSTINLHEEPSITSLLEEKDWDGALTRISHVLTVNDPKNTPSQDYLFRVLLYLSSSFSIISTDKTIEEQLGEEFHLLMRKRSLITKQRVFDWAEKWINNIRRQTTNEIDDTQQRIVAKVRSFIHENLSNDMSLQMISEKVNLHPVYLSKVYKNTTNETIGDYIHRLRMDRADYLLRRTKLKIVEISNELGFLSQSHFIKVFKKHYGFTPEQYRKRKI